MKEQLSKGSVTVTQDSPIVQGDNLVDWTQVDLQSLCLFIHNSKPYDIALVDPVLRRLTLVAPFAGTTATAQPYVIVRDFTSNFDLPRLNPGDLEAAVLFSRLADTMDNLLSKGAGQPSTGEILVAKNAHGFLVGNALNLKTGTWGLANSTSEADATVVGFVKAVPDVNSFTLITQGYVSGIVGMTLVAGTVYSLSNNPTTVTGGKNNLTSNPAFIGLKVPLIMADGPTGGYILNLASGSAGQFSVGVPGTVAAPTQQAFDNNWVLSAKNQWIQQTVSNQSMLSQHLHLTGVMTPDINWTAFLAGGAGYSIMKHIGDLQARLTLAESYGNVTQSTMLRRNKTYPGPTPFESKSFTIPGRVSSVTIYLYTGTAFYGHLYNSLHKGAFGAHLLLKVKPGDVLRAEIGGPWYVGAPLFSSDKFFIRPQGHLGEINLYKNDILTASAFLSTKQVLDLFGTDVTKVGYLLAMQQGSWMAYDMPTNVFEDPVSHEIYIRCDDGTRLSPGVGASFYYPVYNPSGWDVYDSNFSGYAQIIFTN